MTVNLKIEIESGNAAFGEDEWGARFELARILAELGKAIRDVQDGNKVYDVNGNRVGTVELNIVDEEGGDK